MIYHTRICQAEQPLGSPGWPSMHKALLGRPGPQSMLGMTSQPYTASWLAHIWVEVPAEPYKDL